MLETQLCTHATLGSNLMEKQQPLVQELHADGNSASFQPDPPTCKCMYVMCRDLLYVRSCVSYTVYCSAYTVLLA